MKTLAIDFDNTIHDKAHPIPEKRMGPPKEGAQEALQALKMQYRIVIHSVWADEKYKQIIADWLEFYQIPYDEITNVKPAAEAYIDDKGIRFTSWEEVLKQIETI